MPDEKDNPNTTHRRKIWLDFLYPVAHALDVAVLGTLTGLARGVARALRSKFARRLICAFPLASTMYCIFLSGIYALADAGWMMLLFAAVGTLSAWVSVNCIVDLVRSEAEVDEPLLENGPAEDGSPSRPYPANPLAEPVPWWLDRHVHWFMRVAVASLMLAASRFFFMADEEPKFWVGMLFAILSVALMTLALTIVVERDTLVRDESEDVSSPRRLQATDGSESRPYQPATHPESDFDLLPCPFCGFEMAYVHNNSVLKELGVKEVVCSRCFASGPISQNEAVARSSWNARV